jgi:hypothetical protein
MRIIVLDDNPTVVRRVEQTVTEIGEEVSIPLALDSALSEPIHIFNLKERLAALAAMEGEALFFLDMGHRVVESGEGRELEPELRSEYELPHELMSAQTEGFACAVAIIRNKKLTKAVIVVNTNRGSHGMIDTWLRDIVHKHRREDDVAIEMALFALSDSEEKARKIVHEGFRSYIAFLTKSAVPDSPSDISLSPFDFFMFKAQGMSHDDAHTPAKAQNLLATLLGMSEAEVRDELCARLGADQIYDAIKTMGINVPSRPLAASGAWLLALAAFRQKDGARPWQEIFRIDGEWETDLRTCFLLPKQQLGTLRVSIRLFYEMCLALFEPPAGVQQERGPGPVQSVTLSVEHGLRFALSFPSNKGVRGNSLFENVAECRRLAIGGKPLHHHNTSAAIWRYWVACSTADGGDREGLFGEDVWRMNLKETTIDQVGVGTEVSFFR